MKLCFYSVVRNARDRKKVKFLTQLTRNLVNLIRLFPLPRLIPMKYPRFRLINFSTELARLITLIKKNSDSVTEGKEIAAILKVVELSRAEVYSWVFLNNCDANAQNVLSIWNECLYYRDFELRHAAAQEVWLLLIGSRHKTEPSSCTSSRWVDSRSPGRSTLLEGSWSMVYWMLQKLEKERIKKEDEDVGEGQSQSNRDGGNRRRKFTEHGNNVPKSQVLMSFEDNNQAENSENVSEVQRDNDRENLSVQKNGDDLRNRSDSKRGDGRVDKYRSNRSKFDNNRYPPRGSMDRNRKRDRSRSRERRRSREREQSRRSRSSRERKGRRNHSPRRRSSGRSDRRTDDRRDRRNESRKSSKHPEIKEEKQSGDERKSEKPVKNDDKNTESDSQPKFKRRSRSSSVSSRASKEWEFQFQFIIPRLGCRMLF